MQYRQFGRTGWDVSEVGYGMWGMASWTGSDDEESLKSLQHAVDLGCTFFDTAYVYGDGRSEGLLGKLVKANRDTKLFTATKIPPKTFEYPTPANRTLAECYPPDHIEDYLHLSLGNAGLGYFDLLQLHTWHDTWADDDSWSNKLSDLKSQGLIRAFGISVNRWQPHNAVKAVRSGKIDSVQVVYNIFDQNPEDELFPACREMDVAVIARVPFDEGSLAGTLTKETTFPEGDWRNNYFNPANLNETVDRVETLKDDIREGTTLPETALRFILSEPTVSTVIPGMRKLKNVEANVAASDAGALAPELIARLRKHRWNR